MYRQPLARNRTIKIVKINDDDKDYWKVNAKGDLELCDPNECTVQAKRVDF